MSKCKTQSQCYLLLFLIKEKSIMNHISICVVITKQSATVCTCPCGNLQQADVIAWATGKVFSAGIQLLRLWLAGAARRQRLPEPPNLSVKCVPREFFCHLLNSALTLNAVLLQLRGLIKCEVITDIQKKSCTVSAQLLVLKRSHSGFVSDMCLALFHILLEDIALWGNQLNWPCSHWWCFN